MSFSILGVRDDTGLGDTETVTEGDSLNGDGLVEDEPPQAAKRTRRAGITGRIRTTKV
jgi:hypothetical protein